MILIQSYVHIVTVNLRSESSSLGIEYYTPRNHLSSSWSHSIVITFPSAFIAQLASWILQSSPCIVPLHTFVHISTCFVVILRIIVGGFVPLQLGVAEGAGGRSSYRADRAGSPDYGLRQAREHAFSAGRAERGLTAEAAGGEGCLTMRAKRACGRCSSSTEATGRRCCSS